MKNKQIKSIPFTAPFGLSYLSRGYIMSIELHNTQKKLELLQRDNINDLELLPGKEAENGEFEDFSLELTSKQMIRDSHR